MARLNRRHLKLTVAGICEVDAAERLRGARVFAARSDLPALAPGEFYYFQAEGCEVRLSDGRTLGRIEDTFFTGAHDVWVVRTDSGELLIPVIAEVVRSLDLDARRVTIEPLPGLLD